MKLHNLPSIPKLKLELVMNLLSTYFNLLENAKLANCTMKVNAITLCIYKKSRYAIVNIRFKIRISRY